MKFISRCVLLLFFSFLAFFSQAATPSEKIQFHVLGRVKYRCYAGYSGQKVYDSKTKQACDNKSYESVVIDKVVTIDIKDEADPEESKDLAGDWDGKFEFKGRNYIIVMSLFKISSTGHYRLRLSAEDDEPTPRKTGIFSEFKNIKEMNPLSMAYSSSGTKEEMSFSVDVKPSF